MADTPRDARPRTATWVKVLLGLSLALNLAVIGLAAGAAYRFSKGPDKGPMRNGFALIAAMDRADRKAVLSPLRDETRAERQAGRAQSQELIAQLRAETFDAAAVEALLRAQMTRSRSVQDKIQARWLAQVEAMTAAERAGFADRLEERLTKRKKHKGPPKQE